MARILPADWLHTTCLHDGKKEMIGPMPRYNGNVSIRYTSKRLARPLSA